MQTFLAFQSTILSTKCQPPPSQATGEGHRCLHMIFKLARQPLGVAGGLVLHQMVTDPSFYQGSRGLKMELHAIGGTANSVGLIGIIPAAGEVHRASRQVVMIRMPFKQVLIVRHVPNNRINLTFHRQFNRMEPELEGTVQKSTAIKSTGDKLCSQTYT